MKLALALNYSGARMFLAEWRSSGVTTMMVAGDRLAARTIAELVL